METFSFLIINTLYCFSSSFFQNSQFTSLLASQTLLPSNVLVLDHLFFTYTHIQSLIHYMLKTPKFSSLILSFISNVLVATIYLTTRKSKGISRLPFLKQNVDFSFPIWSNCSNHYCSVHATIFYPVIQAKNLEVPLDFSHLSLHSLLPDTSVRLSSFTSTYVSKTLTPILSPSLHNIIFYFYLQSDPVASFPVYTPIPLYPGIFFIQGMKIKVISHHLPF